MLLALQEAYTTSRQIVWPLPMELIAALLIGLLVSFVLLINLATKKAPPFMKSFKQKHVFITGGSSGIGLAIAKRAILEGAFVTMVSRNASNLGEAVDKIVKETQCSPERIRCQAADVGDYKAISSAVKQAVQWKPIDVLVCNAGLTRGGYFDSAQIEELELTIRTNLNGAVYAIHEALPSMKQRSLEHPISIVIISSLASLYFMYGHSVYTATKYALRGLAEGLRFELLPHNIKVNLICPGFVNTPFLDDAEKESEIVEILKKVNLYDRKNSESPDSVASFTLAAVKEGSFLVITQPIGTHLLALGRGFLPADTIGKTLFETILLVPFRLFSLKVIVDIRRNILEGSNRAIK